MELQAIKKQGNHLGSYQSYEQLIYPNNLLDWYTTKLYFYARYEYWFWWLSMCIAEISRSSGHGEENITI